jgi:hypothetical protein
MKTLLFSLLVKVAYVVFGVLYVVYLAYTVFPLMDLTVEIVRPFSWFIKVPAFFAFGVASTAIALVGALPLFWMDRLTKCLKTVNSEGGDSSEQETK